MTKAPTPYGDLPPTAFWRTAVAEPGIWDLSNLWRARWPLPANAGFATYGSCFAQHISRALVARQMRWIDAEPAPGRCPPEIARAFNHGIFSARTANIYTARQLRWIADAALGGCDPAAAEVWADGGRFRDSLRPMIEPTGFASAEEAILSRRSMLRAFRRSVREADLFIFTLGLTEGWESAATGQPYAACPGVGAGQFDPIAHVFRNYRTAEIRADLEAAFALLRRENPALKVLLTVSPVPLTATASGAHVLVATTRSKAVLRAVAGELVEDDAGVDYFPSYEIITGAPARSMFYEPNMRSVAQQGVQVVMNHFFAGLDLGAPARASEPSPTTDDADTVEASAAKEDLVCEESILEAYNRA